MDVHRRCADRRGSAIRSTTIVAVVGVALSIAFAACSSDNTGSMMQEDLIGKWSVATPVREMQGGYWWTFAGDGRFGLYDGCNLVGGTYRVEGGDVEFGEEAGTARACSTDGVMTNGVELSDPPHFRVVEDGTVLIVDTSLGEVRLDRVDEVPHIE